MRKLEVVGAVLVMASLAAACRPRVVNAPVQYLGHDDEVAAPRVVPTNRVFIEVDDQPTAWACVSAATTTADKR